MRLGRARWICAVPFSSTLTCRPNRTKWCGEGVRLADQLKTTWSICHVVPEAFRVRVLFPHEAGVESDTQRDIRAKAIEAMQRQIDSVIGREAQPTEIHLEAGTAHTGILQAAALKEAALIVMAPGTAAGRVARAAGVPLLVFRKGAEGAVLGASDFSDPSLPALHLATSEAKRRTAPLRFASLPGYRYFGLSGRGGCAWHDGRGTISRVGHPGTRVRRSRSPGTDGRRYQGRHGGAATIAGARAFFMKRLTRQRR